MLRKEDLMAKRIVRIIIFLLLLVLVAAAGLFAYITLSEYKPADREDAAKMLKMLSGNTHQVITGLCIISSERVYQDVSVSHVTFAPLSDKEIEAYVSSGECDDKAGAYAIQGGAGKFITNIDGDYYAIMGLPLNSVYEELKKISDY